MARRATIEDDDLICRLSDVFRNVGYEGASLAALSDATGLKKASLYHRFPAGKEQMAEEVLNSAEAWLGDNVLAPLKSGAPPAERVQAMINQLNAFYSGGRQACLLNTLSSAPIHDGPFARRIKRAFRAWIDALAVAVTDAGFAEDAARSRAQRAVMLIQGSLVLSRGTGTTKPFRDCLAALSDELLGQAAH
jgi:AcrR family transcriptional regulator